jgi:hypothetical protein
MHFRSFVVDYGKLMASRYEMLAAGVALLHGLLAPVMTPGIAGQRGLTARSGDA